VFALVATTNRIWMAADFGKSQQFYLGIILYGLKVKNSDLD